MPKQTSFAILYKKLLDCNFTPSQERSDAVLEALLRQLSEEHPTKKRNVSVEESPKL